MEAEEPASTTDRGSGPNCNDTQNILLDDNSVDCVDGAFTCSLGSEQRPPVGPGLKSPYLPVSLRERLWIFPVIGGSFLLGHYVWHSGTFASQSCRPYCLAGLIVHQSRAACRHFCLHAFSLRFSSLKAQFCLDPSKRRELYSRVVS